MQDLRAAGRHAHKNSLPTVRQAVGMLASRHTAVKAFCAALPAAARRTRCALGPCMARSFCSWRMRSSRPGGQPETKIVPTTCFSEKTLSSPAGMDAPAAAPAAEKKHFPLLTPPFRHANHEPLLTMGSWTPKARLPLSPFNRNSRRGSGYYAELRLPNVP